MATVRLSPTPPPGSASRVLRVTKNRITYSGHLSQEGRREEVNHKGFYYVFIHFTSLFFILLRTLVLLSFILSVSHSTGLQYRRGAHLGQKTGGIRQPPPRDGRRRGDDGPGRERRLRSANRIKTVDSGTLGGGRKRESSVYCERDFKSILTSFSVSVSETFFFYSSCVYLSSGDETPEEPRVRRTVVTEMVPALDPAPDEEGGTAHERKLLCVTSGVS